GRSFRAQWTDLGDRPTSDDAGAIVTELMAEFAAGTLGVVELVRSDFQSVLSAPPVTDRLLPIVPPEADGPRPDYILAPDPATLLEDVLPRYVRNAVYRGLVETAAAEQAAR